MNKRPRTHQPRGTGRRPETSSMPSASLAAYFTPRSEPRPTRTTAKLLTESHHADQAKAFWPVNECSGSCVYSPSTVTIRLLCRQIGHQLATIPGAHRVPLGVAHYAGTRKIGNRSPVTDLPRAHRLVRCHGSSIPSHHRHHGTGCFGQFGGLRETRLRRSLN